MRNKLFWVLTAAWMITVALFWRDILARITAFNAAVQAWLEAMVPTPKEFPPMTDGDVALLLGSMVIAVTVLAAIIRNGWRAKLPSPDA